MKNNKYIKAKKLAKSFKNKLLGYLEMAATGKKFSRKSHFLYYIGDISDLVRYCDFVINDQIDKAQRLADDLDTNVYESIPNTLYNLVRSERSY
jgi:hypothetical protein